eukprot:jgi/Mesvir1/19015/Mv12783-RA.1
MASKLRHGVPVAIVLLTSLTVILVLHTVMFLILHGHYTMSVLHSFGQLGSTTVGSMRVACFESTNNGTQRALAQLGEWLEARLENILDEPERTVQFARTLATRNILPYTPEELQPPLEADASSPFSSVDKVVLSCLWSILQPTKYTPRIFLVMEPFGQIVGITRWRPTGQFAFTNAIKPGNSSTLAQFRFVEYDDDGNVANDTAVTELIDARGTSMPGYNYMRTAGPSEIYWARVDAQSPTGAWLAYSNGTIIDERAMQVHSPIQSRHGEFLGIVTAGLPLWYLSQRLVGIVADKNTTVFVYERTGIASGSVLAASCGSPRAPTSDATSGGTALDWDIPEVVFVGQLLLQTFGSWANVPEHNIEQFVLPDDFSLEGGESSSQTNGVLVIDEHDDGRQRHMLVHSSYIRRNGIDWVMIAFVNEEIFVEGVRETLDTTLVRLQDSVSNEEDRRHGQSIRTIVLSVVSFTVALSLDFSGKRFLCELSHLKEVRSMQLSFQNMLRHASAHRSTSCSYLFFIRIGLLYLLSPPGLSRLAWPLL